MPAYYVDASALVKRYIEEEGSAIMDRLLDDPDVLAYVSHIAAAEVVAALTRRGRGERWAEERIDERVDLFFDDLNARLRRLDTSKGILDSGIALARQHGLRGYDAVHLAAAIDINALHTGGGVDPVVLVSADDELNAAAEAEGLAVLNPLH